MSSKKFIAILGSTGNQGGSIIDVVLAHPELQQKYNLRGITRNVSSNSAKALMAKGVEMVAASVNDVGSLQAAFRGSYGVFGVTNFWDKDVLNKEIEIQQGKNIFEACVKEKVQHLVFSSLPRVEVLTNGVLQHVDHFDGKAIVREYIEANKGDMIVSYFMPAMYMASYKGQIKAIDGKPAMIMPFDLSNPEAETWPIIDPRADTGKYVMGFFESSRDADGISVQGVSAWTSPRQLLASISRRAGAEVTFKASTPEAIPAELSWPDQIARELTETMLLVGNYSYYGRGREGNQAESDRWLVKGTQPLGLEGAVENGGPWSFTA